MRIAFLSDAHGNAVATSRCLEAATAAGVDAVYFLGDAIGYLPGERETLDLLRTAGVECQAGNHEAMILGRLPTLPGNEPQYQHGPAGARLGAQGLSVLRSWPDRRDLRIAGRRALLVHGDPADPLQGALYPDSDLGGLDALRYDVIVVGHTHRPFVTRIGSTTVINAGSCGLPRDQGDAPAFAVYDSDHDDASIYRVRVRPEEILSAYGSYPIHESVRACLFRTSVPLIGEFVRDA